ncbi:S8 family serine peptidase [Bacillus sp. FJAT-18017]|uniref:S8 family serine peptidase n=1 Tax=Bacillus sp. FJAT-18017 TaxID=1705566 RepID=UPI0009E7E15D|nr:S8 family serine peptidase [Bacillus sp. FJAT-18017]
MKLKRSFALLMIFLLVFSNSALGAGKPILSQNTKPEYAKGQKQTVSKTDAKSGYKNTDKVRIIVEVEGEPAITYATKQGKKYNELPKATKDKLQAQALGQQKSVKELLSKKAIKMQYKENFTTAFNGFSGVVEFGQIQLIRNLAGVENVTITHEYQRPQELPDMKYSKELVEAQKAWNEYNYKGEGMVVGVIDTGIDPSHRDMVLTDASEASLTKEGVDKVAAEKGLPGKFYTEKVPYGYNYMDENAEILDLGPGASMHGMHVAGTVGANGDEENGGLKGVAPEAQLLALKVFGNDPEMPSTWSDIYVKAIDDAIVLGADVLNMSLGSTASFVAPEDPEQKAIARAVENGVLMSISAGNSDRLGSGFYNTYASNPDKGVVGSPGLSYDSLQVASYENEYVDLNLFTYSLNGTETGKLQFLTAGTADPLKTTTGKYEVVSAGLGTPAEFEGKDFKGKYALISRGSIAFVDKTLNAQKAGAVGAIIYNNTTGTINMADDPAIKIPHLSILQADGLKLKEELDKGTKVEVQFKGDIETIVSPTAGEMSDFTSWGVTPNLDFKPEITAPGGNILSTLNNNEYGLMSGTSMAAPHVAGGSALILQRIEEDFAALTGKEKVNFAKNILMNTSKPVMDKGANNVALNLENPYSPRRQGAGLMQLHAALSTPVVVTEAKTNEAKVALKEINGDTATFTLKAKNFSDKEVTYKVSGTVLTDMIYAKYGIDLGEAQAIFNADTEELPLKFDKEELKVPANDEAELTVTIDLKNNVSTFGEPLEELFENGYFVEGFITLTNTTDEYPELTVPYVGFRGDWNEAPVLDEMIYDGANSYYEAAGMVDQKGSYLGYNPLKKAYESNKIAFSPNGDGVKDSATPVLSFLRNAKTVDYRVLDKDKNFLRKIKSDTMVRKNYYNSGAALEYSYSSTTTWDGKVKYLKVPDGQYYYEIVSTIDYPGKEPQKVQVPVIVDTKVPVVDGKVKGDQLTFTTSDVEGSGVAYVDVLLNGTSVFGKDDLPLAGDAGTYTFKEAPALGSEVTLVAYDYAGNVAKKVLKGVNDTDAPQIFAIDPEPFGIFSTNQVPVKGYVVDETAPASLTVNGNEVELKWNETTKRWDFDTVLTLEDGFHKIRFAGTDVAGNKAADFLRHVFVDTQAPGLDVSVPAKVSEDTTSVELSATLSDNFDEVRFYVDGSEEFYNPLPEPYVMDGYSHTVKTTLPLQPGVNTFLLEVVDVAGNKTTKEVNVFRGKETFTVNYYVDGKVYKTENVIEGSTLKAPAKPVKKGYTFIGWYSDQALKTKFNFSKAVAGNTNLYAKFVKIAAPASVKAASAGYNKVKISWGKVSGAQGYEVYRSTSKYGTYSKIATLTSGTATSYTNGALTPGKTYYYKVVSYQRVDGVKVVSPNSAVVSKAPVLATPTGLSVKRYSATSLKVSWKASSEATGYEVYRATSKSGKYTKVATVTKGSVASVINTKLTKGKTYYYKVRAVKTVSGKKYYSGYSSVGSAKTY